MIYFQPLFHCINISKCKGCIFDSSLEDQLFEIRDDLQRSRNIAYFRANFRDRGIDRFENAIDLKEVK